MRAAVSDRRLEAIAGPPHQTLWEPAPGMLLTPSTGPATIIVAIRQLAPAEYLYDGREDTRRTYAWLSGSSVLTNGTTTYANPVFPNAFTFHHPGGINQNVTVRAMAGQIRAIISYPRTLTPSEADHIRGLLSLSLSLRADATHAPAFDPSLWEKAA